YIECGIVAFRPRMDRDMAFGEHSDAADAAVRLERVQMHVQQRRSGRVHAVDQRALDVLEIVEPFSAVDVDDEVRPGAAYPVLLDEEVVYGFRRTLGTVFLRTRPLVLAGGFRLQVFLLGGLWSVQTHPQLEEGVLRHG